MEMKKLVDINIAFEWMQLAVGECSLTKSLSLQIFCVQSLPIIQLRVGCHVLRDKLSLSISFNSLMQMF